MKSKIEQLFDGQIWTLDDMRKIVAKHRHASELEEFDDILFCLQRKKDDPKYFEKVYNLSGRLEYMAFRIYSHHLNSWREGDIEKGKILAACVYLEPCLGRFDGYFAKLLNFMLKQKNLPR